MTDNANLGRAMGEVGLDTRPFEAGSARVQQWSQRMAAAFMEAGQKGKTGLKPTQDAVEQLATSVQRMQNLASGAFFAGMVQKGMQAAQQVRSINALFKVLSGSEKDAERNLDSLRKMAEKTGQPFLALAEGSTSLLPAIRGTNAELSKTLSVAQRLATLDPIQGIRGASFALREFINGEYTSLSRRFEISRSDLKKIRDEAKGDVGKMINDLSALIDKMGLTEKAAEEMGKSGAYAFQQLRDETTQLSAEAFAPLLNDVVLPLVRAFADFVRQLREANPEILKIVGGLTAMAAASQIAKNLPVVGGMVRNIAASPGIGTVAKAGVAGFIGAEVGVGLTRAAGEMGIGGFERFKGRSQQDVMNELGDRVKQVVVLIANLFIEFAKVITIGITAVKKAFDFIGDVIQKIGLDFQQLIGSIIRGLGELLAKVPGLADTGVDLMKRGSDAENDAKMRRGGVEARIAKVVAEGILPTKAEIEAIEKATEKVKQQVLGGLINFLFPKPEEVEEAVAQAAPAKAAEAKFSEEQIKAFAKFREEEDAINQKANDDIIAENLAYNERRVEIETKALDKLAQLDADEKRRREKAVERLEKSIAAVQAAAAEREVEDRKETDKRIAEIVTDGQEEAIKQAEDHQRELAQMERDHRENLLQAAARLDARAVFEELKSFNRRKQDMLEGADRERTERQKQIGQRVRDEEAGHKERLDKAREADAKRIADMQAAFAEQEAEAKEQYDLRRAEIIQQGIDELAELDKQHTKRLQQIDDQKKEELKKHNDRFVEELNALGEHGGKMLKTYKKGLGDIEKELEAWFQRQQARFTNQAVIVQSAKPGTDTPGGPAFRAANTPTYTPGVPVIPKKHVGGAGRQHGTSWSRLGDWTHEGEIVVSNEGGISDMVRRMLGDNFTSAQLGAAVAAGVSRAGRAIGPISATVNLSDLAGKSPAEIARMAADALEPLIEQRVMDLMNGDLA